MVLVRYSGPIRGAHMLSGELSTAGLQVAFTTPTERRGIGQEIVHLAMRIESDVEAGVVGGAALGAAQRVVRAFKARHPEVDVDVEADETDDE